MRRCAAAIVAASPSALAPVMFMFSTDRFELKFRLLFTSLAVTTRSPLCRIA